METLLPEQTTAGNKMITPSRSLRFSQPEGGRYLQAVRAQSGDSCRYRWPRPATEGRPPGGPQFPRLRTHIRWIVYFAPV